MTFPEMHQFIGRLNLVIIGNAIIKRPKYYISTCTMYSLTLVR